MSPVQAENPSFHFPLVFGWSKTANGFQNSEALYRCKAVLFFLPLLFPLSCISQPRFLSKKEMWRRHIYQRTWALGVQDDWKAVPSPANRQLLRPSSTSWLEGKQPTAVMSPLQLLVPIPPHGASRFRHRRGEKMNHKLF